MMTRFLLLIVLVFVQSANYAQVSNKIKKTYNKGLASFNSKEYDKALKYFRKAANANYDEAQNALGYMYDYGTGVDKDDRQAVYWYRKSAEQGNARAQSILGSMYDNGTGVEKEEKLAVYWYHKAAEQGDVVAQNNLGVMYEMGHGVEQDYEQAVYWYQKAAGQGNAVAQCNIGRMYDWGRGVEQDYMQAAYWFIKSAVQENAEAQCDIGGMYYDGRGGKQDYSQALYWYRKAAEQGHSKAQCNLGCMYDRGDGVEKNDTLAVYWYHKAAEQGDTKAQCNLGFMYDTGMGVEKNDTLAVYWYKKSAEQGYAQAQDNLGVMYDTGRGVKKNDNLAAYWYNKAADQGFAKAQYGLGNMFLKGRGVKQDYSKAFYWTSKAANQGFALAQNNLAYLYYNGLGVTKDEKQADYWLKKSEEKDEMASSSCKSQSDNTAQIISLSTESSAISSNNPLSSISLYIEKRIALIIGNSDYDVRLPNAEKDASALVKVLSTLNFDVVPCMNKELRDMKETIADFCEKAKGYDIALIYYSGHAVQDDGVNYLIPARPKSVLNSAEMEDKYVLLSWMIRSLQKSNVGKNIVILDACRDRPSFVCPTRGAQGGLASVSEPIGFLIAYATQAGMTASDGTGNNNSPYATALLEELKKPKQTVDQIFINVRERVMELTDDVQKPFYKNNLNEKRNNKFYFNLGVKRY
ncbi:MAG: SEL1-like repeat protein [Prevotella sp.]|nr:SEL1-like repeat protein [Prevotella sp.]